MAGIAKKKEVAFCLPKKKKKISNDDDLSCGSTNFQTGFLNVRRCSWKRSFAVHNHYDATTQKARNEQLDPKKNGNNPPFCIESTSVTN
jgi:hypothetical protein